MRDVLFLAKHRGWTYADLQDTPDVIVHGLMLLDRKISEAEKRGQ